MFEDHSNAKPIAASAQWNMLLFCYLSGSGQGSATTIAVQLVLPRIIRPRPLLPLNHGELVGPPGSLLLGSLDSSPKRGDFDTEDIHPRLSEAGSCRVGGIYNKTRQVKDKWSGNFFSPNVWPIKIELYLRIYCQLSICFIKPLYLIIKIQFSY